MPVYQVDVQTKCSGIYISNIYHVLLPTLEEAIQAGTIIADAYKTLLPPFYVIDYLRASVPGSADDTFISIPVNIPGTRAASTQMMPLFNRFRVTFNTGTGRPGVKFLVGPQEGDSDGSDFTPAAVALVQDNFIDPLLENGLVQLCKADGTLFGAGVLASAVGMRQLRRASKRKAPVIGG